VNAIPLEYFVTVGALLFVTGCIGFLLRRNLLVLLMSIELMLNAVNLTFLTFSRFPLAKSAPTQAGFLAGHTAAFFVIAVAAAEAAVGLAIVIAIFRSRTSVNVDEFDTLKF